MMHSAGLTQEYLLTFILKQPTSVLNLHGTVHPLDLVSKTDALRSQVLLTGRWLSML
jgi:hypothetical protein